MARLRTGEPMLATPTVEQALATTMTPAQNEMIEMMRLKWVIDEPAAAAERLGDLAGRLGVDEVMVVPGAGSRDADALGRVPGRERTLELLASAVLSTRPEPALAAS
jgi:hypothetical protein